MAQPAQTPATLNPAQLKSLMNLVMGSADKMQAMQQLIMSHPAFQQVANYANSHGGDYKTAFYQLAKENGFDPNMILSEVSSLK